MGNGLELVTEIVSSSLTQKKGTWKWVLTHHGRRKTPEARRCGRLPPTR